MMEPATDHHRGAGEHSPRPIGFAAATIDRETFRARRHALRLRQDEYADALGISRQSVIQWESGVRPLPLYAERFLTLLERVPEALAHVKRLPMPRAWTPQDIHQETEGTRARARWTPYAHPARQKQKDGAQPLERGLNTKEPTA